MKQVFQVLQELKEAEFPHLLVKPSTSKQTDRFAAHGGLLGSDLKLEGEMVDGCLVAPGIVLQDPRQEGLREVEAGDPEHNGRTPIDPVLETMQTNSIRKLCHRNDHVLCVTEMIMSFVSQK